MSLFLNLILVRATSILFYPFMQRFHPACFLSSVGLIADTGRLALAGANTALLPTNFRGRIYSRDYLNSLGARI